MASVEVMKERARIAGRFNLSARRNPEHKALVALAAQKVGGECQVVPVAPGEDEAVARIVEHIRNRVNEDPKPSTETAE